MRKQACSIFIFAIVAGQLTDESSHRGSNFSVFSVPDVMFFCFTGSCEQGSNIWRLAECSDEENVKWTMLMYKGNS